MSWQDEQLVLLRLSLRQQHRLFFSIGSMVLSKSEPLTDRQTATKGAFVHAHTGLSSAEGSFSREEDGLENTK